MLTNEQIDVIAMNECDFMGSHRCDKCVVKSECLLRRVADQAISAIDLAAENATLKAKLDTVRKAATEETYGTANMSWSKAMQKILEIIKDGEPK